MVFIQWAIGQIWGTHIGLHNSQEPFLGPWIVSLITDGNIGAFYGPPGKPIFHRGVENFKHNRRELSLEIGTNLLRKAKGLINTSRRAK